MLISDKIVSNEKQAEAEVAILMRMVMTKLNTMLRRIELWQITKGHESIDWDFVSYGCDLDSELKDAVVKLQVVRKKLNDIKERGF